MKNRAFIFFTILIIIAIAVFFFVSPAKFGEKKSGDDLGKTKIITTLFPLYDMAKNIGGNTAEVSLLVPPGLEAHSFEPKPSDIVKINEADIFVFTDKYMEPWAQDIINGVTNSGLAIVDSSKGITLIPSVFGDADEPAGTPDPHIWLDFDNAKVMAENIESAIESKDPVNAEFYRANLAEYVNGLDVLNSEYASGLTTCEQRNIVYGGHYAFGYMAKKYGLNYFAAQGVSPDSEPTAKDLAELVEQIRSNNIKYVFYEELSSPKIAEAISSEAGAKLLLLNGAHNLSQSDFNTKVSFFDILKEDLNNLRVGLGCK